MGIHISQRRKAKAKKESILATLAFHSFCKALPDDWGKMPDEPKVAPLTPKDLAGFTKSDWSAIKKSWQQDGNGEIDIPNP